MGEGGGSTEGGRVRVGGGEGVADIEGEGGSHKGCRSLSTRLAAAWLLASLCGGGGGGKPSGSGWISLGQRCTLNTA